MVDYEFDTFNPVTAWHKEEMVVKKIFKKDTVSSSIAISIALDG
jgi:hypothetical protein